MIDMFSQRSPQNKELLAGVVMRPPDVIFDQEALNPFSKGRVSA
jgi:hypothetical protein